LSEEERKVSRFVNVTTIRDVAKTLVSDEMQGRGTATAGGEKAAVYIGDQFAKLGLKPIGDAGRFLQPIKFNSSQVLPTSSIKVGEASLKYGSEFVFSPPYPGDQVSVSGRLVFAGYGAVSSELGRDDLAGIDVKGKIVILISGRPNNVSAELWG